MNKVVWLIKVLASCLILGFFVFGVGFYGSPPHALKLSLNLLHDTQWDPSFLWRLSADKALALILCLPTGLGFLGWAVFFQNFFFPRAENKTAKLLGLSLGLGFFSFYVFGLGINEILYKPLVFLFFIPALKTGWIEWKTTMTEWKKMRAGWPLLLLALPFLLWAVEYLSPPIIWDAVLDHFRYAREVSRLHQIPFHWTNHTGDMPKAAELVLAGFWSMGGESFSKLSGVIPALLTVWLLVLFLAGGIKNPKTPAWIFLTCPFFLAIFSWGYVEGFLAFFEILALYCLWKAQEQPAKIIWSCATAFFFGFSVSIKYTAAFAMAAAAVLWIYLNFVQKKNLKLRWSYLAFFMAPLFAWLLKNWMAFGNPFYPLATVVFGTPFGYGTGMEKELLGDTGLPQGFGFLDRVELFWKVFFTSDNAVAAVWTPLVFMAIPWGWRMVRSRLGVFLGLFSAVFFLGWIFLCTSLRHASGGMVALVLMAAMAWETAFQEGKNLLKVLFVAGATLSFWLCLSAQLNSTAPYASALGLEDPFLRLKRQYTYDTDVYRAYSYIQNHSDPRDKVMAFAVWQTYPLERTAFVDFKWKKPIFLDWASHCKTAEQLAKKLHEEGIAFFLYQEFEAKAMSKMEKDFELDGMPVSEYEKFWMFYMEPIPIGENSTVYGVRSTPLENPRKLKQLPGLQEKGYWKL